MASEQAAMAREHYAGARRVRAPAVRNEGGRDAHAAIPVASLAEGGAHDRLLRRTPRRRARRRSGRHRSPAPGRRGAPARRSRSSGTGSRRPLRRKRASGDRARAWCRHRCRGSGSNISRMRLSREQPFGDGDLLLVAAGEGADRRPQRARRSTSTRSSTPATAAVSRAPVDQAQAAEAVDHRQRRHCACRRA